MRSDEAGDPARPQPVGDRPQRVAALEVGGTHVSAAVVDLRDGTPVAGPMRRPLDGTAGAGSILDVMASAARSVGRARSGRMLGIAMPGPFDYAAGVGRYRLVGKFEALTGVDVGAALRERLQLDSVAFVNDGEAFTLGEARYGAASGASRCVGITFGTGVGSGWVVDGALVTSGAGVPPDGHLHHVEADGKPLEETVSRRAIRAAYATATGDTTADVREICDRACDGEPDAGRVLAHAFRVMGRALAPRLREFGAGVLVVGGSMTGSWPLLEPWLLAGMGGDTCSIRVSADTEMSALRGAAAVAARR